MKAFSNNMANPVRTTLIASALIAATCALPAGAQIPFSQTAGWFMGPPTSVVTLPTNIQKGGVEFFGPLPASPVPPPSTFSTIGWGCSSSGVCAAGAAASWPVFPNTAALATTSIDPFGPGTGRSALRVTGNSGLLPDAPNWIDVTKIEQYNNPVFGNVLDTAEVHSFLSVGGNVIDGPGGSVTTVEFTETLNDGSCTDQAAPSAPVNPLGSNCDDFAFVSGLDLSPIPLSATQGIRFRINATPGSGALVCPGSTAGQPAACGNYDGTGGILIYTAEGLQNQFSIQAQVFSTTNNPIPLFVIGDCEYDQAKLKKGQTGVDDATAGIRDVGDVVNFWGSQWWKNNCMSLFVDNGYPAFKGFATNVDLRPVPTHPCGQWQARPGNSGHPPDTIPDVIAIIVTDNVIKNGPNIGGNIKQIVIVDRDAALGDNYAGNPGHQGWGRIVDIKCGPGTP